MDDQSPQSHSVRDVGNHRVELGAEVNGERLALYNFCGDRPERLRILVLKLDHRGDFLIGLPALGQLRAAFPRSHITLVCGSWNLSTALHLRVADEVRAYDFFPENAQGWNGDPVEDIDRFREACPGRYDIAIDLRVDEDTRPLLQHVDATLRCGIGSHSRFPFLNIALPGEARIREVQPLEADAMVFDPGAFNSRMPVQTAFFHETDFSVSDRHLVYGPYSRLPLGELRAGFGFQLLAPFYCKVRQVEIAIEVVRGGAADVIAFQRIREVPNASLTTVALEFANDDPSARYEFRVFVGGHPRRTRLRFFGVRIEVLKEHVKRARFLPSELHVGERLSLLVHLVSERMRSLYPPGLFDRIVAGTDPAPAPIAGGDRYVVIAPFSNSTVRDWPFDRYAELVGLLLSETDRTVALVGAGDHASQLDQLCQRHRGERRLVNLAGQTDWAGLAAVLRRADLVIANNSGVAHLAAACGRPTLAIYSGSHQPQEWGPRGGTVRALTAAVACSPCGHEQLELCPHDHLCMKLIEPDMVLHYALAMLAPDDATANSRTEAAPPIEAKPPVAPSLGVAEGSRHQ